jgi:hypothetical protein
MDGLVAIILLSFLGLGALAGLVLWWVLARRRPRPDPAAIEIGPPEPSCFLPQEWELARRSHCLPLHCPRLAGSPPQPPKDTHCEICAAMFLNRYWTQLLNGPEKPEEHRRVD